MKIAMLSSDYLPNIGGIASHIYELSKALTALGHDIEIWYWDRKKESPDTTTMGHFPVRFLDDGQVINNSFKIARNIGSSINDHLKGFSADIIHIHTMDPLLLSTRYISKNFIGKIVWTNHSSRFVRKTSNSFFERVKMKLYTSAIDGLLTASEDRLEASAFLNFSAKLNVANGVNIEQFSGVNKQEARNSLDIDQDVFVILYTGRFAPIKGVTYLAQAIVELNTRTDNFICIMCGNIEGDRESEKVKSILDQSGATHRARFEGFIPNNQLKKLFGRLRCFGITVVDGSNQYFRT